MNYDDFLLRKAQLGGNHGFEPIFMPDFLFDFQKSLVGWSVLKGRGAIFADCGLGKSPIALTWAENIARKTNKNVLMVTPLAVSHQMVREGEKFGIECKRSSDGKPAGKITVTNYERLHLFEPSDYIGFIGDESGILKNFDGKTKTIVTEFIKKMPYRLMGTATAAPNDFIELGTHSEALGEMGFMDMLSRFFKNEQNTSDTKGKWVGHGGTRPKWRFKKHAQVPFWKWVCSWARAVRRPSDLGFDDGKFQLPPLVETQHVIENQVPLFGELFIRPAVGLKEQREELRLTLEQRCEKAAELLNGNTIAVAWCHQNAEGDLLEKLIPGSLQVKGSQSDDEKEEKLRAFCDSQARVLVTKPKIAGFGLNLQFCNHTTFFPSHSYEQYYQSVRRFWRFGQDKPVTVDVVTTQGGLSVLENLQRKSAAADKMFSQLVKYMNESSSISRTSEFKKKAEVPAWL